MAMNKFNVEALKIDDLVQFLKSVGSAAATREIIDADIAAGCPVNPDGTINLLKYAAWLVRNPR